MNDNINKIMDNSIHLDFICYIKLTIYKTDDFAFGILKIVKI